jgi:two-component system, OmpR family, sensor kinase
VAERARPSALGGGEVSRPPALPLRLRLLIGAGLIAALALTAAGLAAWGAALSARVIAEAAAAQHRIELLAQLSARVGDYALVAVESAAAGLDPAERAERLAARADMVWTTFDAVAAALGEAVDAVDPDEHAERSRRAARGLGLARMQANFEALAREAPRAETAAGLRARLDSFATFFAPLLNEALETERRVGQEARLEAERQRRQMRWIAVAVAFGAVLLLVGFHLGLVRPLLARLDRVAVAAETVGRGGFDRTPPVDQHDELGLVFAQINRMASRLGRARTALEHDRARLEETVAARTSELQAANARLEEIDAERRRLFADIGHELRTPLTVILAETELAARAGTSDPGELGGALATIRARARRLNRRIEDLLRVARSESGQIELEEQPFDLADAARDAIEDVAPLARKARVALTADLASVRAYGDRDWSRQVAAGVIENAIRHSPEGAEVAVVVADHDGRIALTVTDEGEGVPTAEQERVFERHTRSARRGLGFGVGLALARWIMSRQHGTITLASPVRKDPARPGTRVTLTWPATGAEADG